MSSHSQFLAVPIVLVAAVSAGWAPSVAQDINATRWRYSRPATGETTILNISKPKDVQLCVDNKGATVNFQVTYGTAAVAPTETSVATGCASLGSVRRVSILQSRNGNISAAGGLLKHADFDTIEGFANIDRSRQYQWSYSTGNNSVVYKDDQNKARVLRICVDKGEPTGGWAVNFRMKGHPSYAIGSEQEFTVTGTKRFDGQATKKAPAKGAGVVGCAIVEATEIWIVETENPGGPSEGYYQFLR